jgi:hypothetical protein
VPLQPWRPNAGQHSRGTSRPLPQAPRVSCSTTAHAEQRDEAASGRQARWRRLPDQHAGGRRRAAVAASPRSRAGCRRLGHIGRQRERAERRGEEREREREVRARRGARKGRRGWRRRSPAPSRWLCRARGGEAERRDGRKRRG